MVWDLVSLAVVAFMLGAAVMLLRHGVFTVQEPVVRQPALVHVHAHLV